MLVFILAAVLTSVCCLRLNCHPDDGPSSRECRRRGCLWLEDAGPRVPRCVFEYSNRSALAGYDVDELTVSGALLSRRSTPSLFGGDVVQLKAEWSALSCNVGRLAIRRRSAATDDAGFISAPLDTPPPPTNCVSFGFHVDERPFGVAVKRRLTDALVFDSRALPGFTFAEQFVQLTTRAPTRHVYGLGEQWHARMQRRFDWRRLSLFTHDEHPAPGRNLYGFEPLYVGLDARGHCYGVLVNNAHAMDFFLQPEPDLITVRVVGGSLDLFFFLGPTFDEVIAEYTRLVGRPALPPFWALGFQLSHASYGSLDHLAKVLHRNRVADIPQDVQMLDVEYMNKRMVFTLSVEEQFQNLSQFVSSVLHRTDRKLVIIVDPGIASRPASSYSALERGLNMSIFIRDGSSGKPFEGQMWPGHVYWPDFTHPRAIDYWTTEIQLFHQQLPFDGIWLDENDPANFYPYARNSTVNCSSNSLNFPPYVPVSYKPIFTKTLCMDAVQHAGRHYAWHNLYGHAECAATAAALQSVRADERPFVLTRSTAPGSGRHAAHWMGDTRSDWASLRQSIVAMLEFNMFGVPLVGSDICGFAGDADEELCLRWSQLGAFYPLSRNHNDAGQVDQDPAAWSPATVSAVRHALRLRYALLPHLYTLFHAAHTAGRAVVKPLFASDPADVALRRLDDQFLWGDHLMIVPILEANATRRSAYFPRGRWFDLNARFRRMRLTPTRRRVTVPIAGSQIGLFVRGGAVLPWQRAALTTAASRLSPFGIVVAPNERRVAGGSLFWDDGAAPLHRRAYCLLTFTAVNQKGGGRVTVAPSVSRCPHMPRLNDVLVADVSNRPTKVTVNRVPLCSAQVEFDLSSRLLRLKRLKIPLKSAQATKILWTHS